MSKFTLKEAKEEIVHLSRANQMLMSMTKMHSDQIAVMFEKLVDLYTLHNQEKAKTAQKLVFPQMWKKSDKLNLK